MTSDKDAHRLISLRQLSYLVALAEHKSISAAASALQMAQPSMSENIARLERNLDLSLATRGSRGIEMTEAGQFLAERGAEILQSLDDAVAATRNLSSTPCGPVTFGLPPGLSLLLSVPLLETVYAEYPDIRLSITEGLSGDVLDWIETGRMDIGVAYDAFESATYTLEPLLEEEVFLVAAPDMWDGPIGPDGVAEEAVDISRLSELPLVMTSSRGAQALHQKVGNAFGGTLNVVATLNSLPQIVEMVSRGSAFAVLGHGAVHRQVTQGRLALVPIEDSVLSRTAYLVRRRSRHPSEAVNIVEKLASSIMFETVTRHAISGIVPHRNALASEPSVLVSS